MSKIVQHTDLSKPVYEILKKMIRSGELKPGQKLVQEQLAQQLGVSRTPLLKALQSLEHEMLVESIPRRGMYVKEVSLEEMIHVYECREAIEGMAVRLLISRATKNEIQKLAHLFDDFESTDAIDQEKYSQADERFHDMIIKLSKNPVLAKMSSVSQIHKRVYEFGLVRVPTDTLSDHKKIIAAILEHNADEAENQLRRHISQSKNILIERYHQEDLN